MTTAIETTIAAEVEHQIPSVLLQKKVQVTVIGCGGTGSAIAAGLPYLHQAIIALGHPHGLDVILVDGDRISRTTYVNLSVRVRSGCIRQQYLPPESICFGAWAGKGCRTLWMKVGGTKPTF